MRAGTASRAFIRPSVSAALDRTPATGSSNAPIIAATACAGPSGSPCSLIHPDLPLLLGAAVEAVQDRHDDQRLLGGDWGRLAGGDGFREGHALLRVRLAAFGAHELHVHL